MQCESFANNPIQPSQSTRSDPGHETNSIATKPAPAGSQCFDEAVRAEAAKVQAKFMSHVDTTTEVVLRFDFMSEHDSRVSNSAKHAP